MSNTCSSTAVRILDTGASWFLSREFGSKDTLAIEASSDNFKMLSLNQSINNSSFEPRHNAISGKAGEKVELFGRGKHAGFSLRPDWGRGDDDADVLEVVETVTLDSVVGENESRPIVIKLDVEGVEIEAMGGAQHVANQDSMIIYEDFGGDTGSPTSDFVLISLPSYTVYYVDEANQVSHVSNLVEIEKIKVKPTQGYNFFAVKIDGVFDVMFKSRLTK